MGTNSARVADHDRSSQICNLVGRPISSDNEVRVARDVLKLRDVQLPRLETIRLLTEAQSLHRCHGYMEVPAFSDEGYAHHWFDKQPPPTPPR